MQGTLLAIFGAEYQPHSPLKIICFFSPYFSKNSPQKKVLLMFDIYEKDDVLIS
jgi:hypothetical protein